MSKLSLEELQNWPFKLGASFRLVAKELLSRGWTISLFEGNNDRLWGYFIIEKGDKSQIVASLKNELFTNLNSRLGYLITTNKARTYEYAREFKVPVPESRYVTPDEQVKFEDFQHWAGVVVKPVNGSSGSGITVDVQSAEKLSEAITAARSVDERIVIQEFLRGDDHRLLFLDYQLFAAVRREPAAIVGDGTHTVKELIETRNSIPKSEDYQGTTSDISLAEVERVFGAELLRSTPAVGEKVKVSDKANLSLGGDAFDVTDTVHPAYQTMLAPVIKSLGLGICGVDVLTTDITEDPAISGAKILEFNAAPNIRPHLYPTEGIGRDAAIKIVDMLEQEA